MNNNFEFRIANCGLNENNKIRNQQTTIRNGKGFTLIEVLLAVAILAVIMTVVCFLQPATPPKGAAEEGIPMLKALGMLSNVKFAVFIGASLVVAGLMQFYFLGSARFLMDTGVSAKNVPGIMGIAQAAQAIATWFLLSLMLKEIGPKWTITVGAAWWALLYLVYVLKSPTWALVGSQTFHGLAYVFFMIGGQIYVGQVATKDIASSAQALIFLVTNGVGLFLGTQLAAAVMDRCSVEGKFDWSKVFMVPLLLTLAGVVALAVGF